MVSIGISILGAGDLSAHVFASSLLSHKIGSNPIFSIVAVWDSNVKLAHEFANAFSLPQSICCGRGDDALTRHDVIVAAICGISPANQPAIAAKAIHAGKHVLLVPGYPLSIHYDHNLHLTEALAAYPSLVCAVASGFHYLPAFVRLRSEVLSRLRNDRDTVRSISFSATSSPAILFGRKEWQADCASGGGALSQLGAPMLDAALGLLLQVKDRLSTTSTGEQTSVVVQGRTAQLLDDSTDFASHSVRLWPRTAEDACWIQVDLRKRVLADCHNIPNTEWSSFKKPAVSQTVVCLEIVSSEAISADSDDPMLSAAILADGSLRFKTDGRSLWFWEKASLSATSSLIYNCDEDRVDGNSLLLESIKHFSNLLASELADSMSAPDASGIDSGVLFSSVLQKLLQSRRVIDVSVALASQKLIDAVRSSLLGTAVSLTGDDVPSNHLLWSHCL